MKKLIILLLALLLVIAGIVLYKYKSGGQPAGKKVLFYRNPMNPEITSPVAMKDSMGMDYVPVYEEETKEKKVLYYRNPMNPKITSPVAMKDSMGMDYIPVYEEEQKSAGSAAGVNITAEKQQLIGITKETVQIRNLIKEISTVGKVAYDPDLYVAQQEYLEVIKLNKMDSDLTAAVERKLYLMGMSQEQIKQLAEQGKPQENLYLPSNNNIAWVYSPVYESDLSLVKPGLPIEVTTKAYPGETYTGKIVALSPVLDPKTRAVQARAEVTDTGHKLKPEMYVNVRILVPLGEKLAVSEEAVMDTGERTVVFVALPDGYFETRNIKLGQKAQGYYEVLNGLKAGEEVAAAGNFFIDSESKLKAVPATK
ncbi:MAG: efflux RND transporter periplasmic adaptor subunit [bacterium]|nr:efflux RND transporter periplasmic adaptor subunit [bacterium]